MQIEEIKTAMRRMLAGLEARKKSAEEAIECIRTSLDFFEELDATSALLLDAYTRQEQPPEEDKKTHFAKIRIALAVPPSPKSLAEIETFTGIPRASVSAVIYRTHREYFESVDTPGSPTKKWRLKELPAATQILQSHTVPIDLGAVMAPSAPIAAPPLVIGPPLPPTNVRLTAQMKSATPKESKKD
jgi:hypothetical protein